MPQIKIMQLGKPSVETLVADGATYNDAFDALGIDRPADGTLLLNGATPVRGGDRVPGTGNASATVHYNAQVKGA
jgi:hypothetical protein